MSAAARLSSKSMTTSTAAPGAFALSATDAERLRARLEEAVRRARRSRSREILATLTIDAPAGTDPTAVAVASRRGDESWFAFEQPDT